MYMTAQYSYIMSGKFDGLVTVVSSMVTLTVANDSAYTLYNTIS